MLHAVTHLIAAHLDEKNVDRVINYINKLPIEFQTICLQNAIHKNRELINQDVIQSWIIEKRRIITMKTKVLEIILNALSAAEDSFYDAKMEFGKLSAKKLS